LYIYLTLLDSFCRVNASGLLSAWSGYSFDGWCFINHERSLSL